MSFVYISRLDLCFHELLPSSAFSEYIIGFIIIPSNTICSQFFLIALGLPHIFCCSSPSQIYLFLGIVSVFLEDSCYLLADSANFLTNILNDVKLAISILVKSELSL